MAAPRSKSSPAEAHRQELARAVSAAAHAEQRRLAQTLHDTLAQSLTGAYLQARVVVQKLAGDPSGAATDAAALAEMLHATVLDLRKMTRQLHPGEDGPPGPAS